MFFVMLCLLIVLVTGSVVCEQCNTGFEFNFYFPNTNQDGCLNHGVCVNYSSTASACLCNKGYSGASDMFDLEFLSVNNTRLSLNCPMSDLGVDILYGILLSLLLVRTCLFLPASLYIVFARSSKKTPRSSSSSLSKAFVTILFAAIAREPISFKTLLFFETFVTMPFGIAFALLKLVNKGAIGTDVALTLCFSVFQIACLYTAKFLWFLRFRKVFEMRSADGSENIKLFRRIHLTGVLLAFAQVLFLYVALGISSQNRHSNVGPIKNNIYVLLILRNCAALLLTVAGVCGLSILYTELAKINAILVEANTGDEASKRALVEKLLFLRKIVDRAKRFAMLAVTLLVIANVPYFYFYQSYVIGIIQSIIAINTNFHKEIISEYWRNTMHKDCVEPAKAVEKLNNGKIHDPNSPCKLEEVEVKIRKQSGAEVALV